MTPLWFLVLDAWLLGDHHISRRGLAGLALGIVGMVVLLWPKLTASGTIGRRELWYSAELAWPDRSAGRSVRCSRSSGTQPISIRSVPRPGKSSSLESRTLSSPSESRLRARRLDAAWHRRMLYLVVGGSWIGYTSYIWLLRHAPSSKVSTYAYVNPVVAVFLGWLVLHEAIDRYILIGSAIIIASVIMVTSAKIRCQAGSGRNAGSRSGGRLVRISGLRIC